MAPTLGEMDIWLSLRMARKRRWRAPPALLSAFVAEASREGAVSEDGRHAGVLARQVPGHGHAIGRREGRGGVSRSVDVVFALGPLEEPRDASVLTDGLEGLAPSREDLVDVGLVPHIPHGKVLGSVQRVVEGHGQLHHAQAAGEVPAHLGDHFQKVRPKLVAELGQSVLGQGAEVFGAVQSFQKRVVGQERPFLEPLFIGRRRLRVKKKFGISDFGI